METVIAAKAKMYAAIVTRPSRVQEREESNSEVLNPLSRASGRGCDEFSCPDRDDSLIFSLLTANVGAYDEQGRRGLFKKNPAQKPKSIKLPDGPSQSRPSRQHRLVVNR
jgi:hypothetical protein